MAQDGIIDGIISEGGLGHTSALSEWALWGAAVLVLAGCCVAVQAGSAGAARRRAARSSLSRHALRLREISLASRASMGRKGRRGRQQEERLDKERLMSMAEGNLGGNPATDDEILE